jgi:hypothetical protein
MCHYGVRSGDILFCTTTYKLRTHDDLQNNQTMFYHFIIFLDIMRAKLYDGGVNQHNERALTRTLDGAAPERSTQNILLARPGQHRRNDMMLEVVHQHYGEDRELIKQLSSRLLRQSMMVW